ncbi:MAG: serpin family protein [Thermodesulfobacteriota bacterium]|nr:serpin family protein [Thermodesulfobacteriota bacterium]
MDIFFKFKKIVIVTTLLMSITLYSCMDGGDGLSSADTSERSDIVVITSSSQQDQNTLLERSQEIVDIDDLSTLVSAINSFGIELYKELTKKNENISISPYSTSISLAATSAAANGDTLQEILSTLHFDFNHDRVHALFNYLDLTITRNGNDKNRTPLRSIQSAWGQEGYCIYLDFYNQLSNYYGIVIKGCDFSDAPEDARNIINLGINEHFLINFSDSAGTLTRYTRLVLMNLISFDATWDIPFNQELTHEADFFKKDYTHVSTPFMSQTGIFNYAKDDGVQVVEIPFEGGRFSALLILPDALIFHEFENELDILEIERMMSVLEPEHVQLEIPSFFLDCTCFIKDLLKNMGITTALIEDTADFSRANDEDNLYIKNVRSQTKHRVNEAGWVGESSTVVNFESIYDIPYSAGGYEILGGATFLPPFIGTQPPINVTFDHPFLYVVRDLNSGAILFIGRVMDPTV